MTRAPARISIAALRAATSPPPTTRQFRSFTLIKIGKKSIGFCLSLSSKELSFFYLGEAGQAVTRAAIDP